MSELEPRDLMDREVARVVWSPDGKFLGYTAGTRIMKISLDGGESQAVCDARGEFDWGGGAGSPGAMTGRSRSRAVIAVACSACPP